MTLPVRGPPCPLAKTSKDVAALPPELRYQPAIPLPPTLNLDRRLAIIDCVPCLNPLATLCPCPKVGYARLIPLPSFAHFVKATTLRSARS